MEANFLTQLPARASRPSTHDQELRHVQRWNALPDSITLEASVNAFRSCVSIARSCRAHAPLLIYPLDM